MRQDYVHNICTAFAGNVYSALEELSTVLGVVW